MANEPPALPANILTTKQYEEQQAKLLAKDTELIETLKLFTTQLKNQNPLDPMENEAFVAQLAQFPFLEAMTGVRSSMDSMAADSKIFEISARLNANRQKNRAIRKPGEY